MGYRVAIALWLALLAGTAAAQSRPANYGVFTQVSTASALTTAIQGTTTDYVWVQPGTYTLSNPITINRSGTLYIHCADRKGTILTSSTPTSPMLTITAASLVQIAGCNLFPTQGAPTTQNAFAVWANNSSPIILEMLDDIVQSSVIEIDGPGTYRMQALPVTPGGVVNSPIVLNNASADLFYFGGDTSNGKTNSLAVAGDYAHIWQKHGRLRAYGTTFEAGLGTASIRIDTPGEPLGPHILGNLRSEGNNGVLNNQPGTVSRMLFVPSTTAAVNVLVKGSGGPWFTGPAATPNNCKFVSYNGAGTLWLVGNRMDGPCGLNLVEGVAPGATIVSIGNQISSPTPFSGLSGQSYLFTADELFDNLRFSGSGTNPIIRWTAYPSAPSSLTTFGGAPAIPVDTLPTFLSRPPMPSKMNGFISVKDAPYNAHGDGVTDDTTAIQTALNSQCNTSNPTLVYFPSGTYLISSVLFFNSHLNSTCNTANANPLGNWFAGAGSGSSIIKQTFASKIGVFESDGLEWATISGLTFQTWPWLAADPKNSAFDVEAFQACAGGVNAGLFCDSNNPCPGSSCSVTWNASQLNNFYDVIFDGGWAGFSTGQSSSQQCSSQVVFGGTFRNSHFGMNSGGFNAIANGAVGSTFTSNDYNIASETVNHAVLGPGGTWFTYQSTATKSRTADAFYVGTSSGDVWYYYNWTTDAPSYLGIGGTGNSFPPFFENAALTPSGTTTPLFSNGGGMGPLFLNSTASRTSITTGVSNISQNYAIKINSVIPDWSTVTLSTSPNASEGVKDSWESIYLTGFK